MTVLSSYADGHSSTALNDNVTADLGCLLLLFRRGRQGLE